MSKADAVEPPPPSDQGDVPRLGLLQCPNAELLGWTAPSSEPNSTLTSDVDGNVMVMASPKRLHDRLGDDESDTSAPSKSKHIDIQKDKEGNNEESSFKRRRTSPTKSVYLSNPGDGCAGGDDDAINEAQDLSTIQASKNNDTGSNNVVDDAKSAIKAVLDYETDSSDSMQDGKRCQILSVTLPSFGDNNDDSSSSTLLSNAAIVIGTISGRAKLELLPIISETDESHELSSSIFLDIFGYRLQSKSITSSKSNSIIINRPDWMNSLPLTVITNNFTVSGTSITLRVKLHSIYDENDTSTIQATTNNESANNESYYSAYAEESYNIKTLPPGYIIPGNYTLGGSGVTTILKPWGATMDAVTKTLQRHDESNCNRILICGAKGCGKSTMLRYATNRILSERIMKGSGSTDVAVLDLDCGQPELSVPGLITLTIVSQPLLSDPPLHMVHGVDTIAVDTDEKHKSKQSLHHEAAYFFGDITSKADPDKYVEMATLLMHKYNNLKKDRIKQGKEHLPLLINTDGWVKGFGYEILCAVIEASNPGNIIQMVGTTKTKSFDLPSQSTIPSASNHRFIHTVQSFDETRLVMPEDDNRSRRSMDSSYSTGPLQATASDHRKHRFCAYFMGGYDEMVKRRMQFTSQPDGITFHREKGVVDPNNILGLTMASMLPYAIPFHSVALYSPPGYLDGISEFQPSCGTRGDFASDDILDALNGSIVGLCCREDMFASAQTTQNNSRVPVLHCVGIGIIRSIDRDRKLFFVLTPVHPTTLFDVNVFVGGNISVPLELVFRGTNADSFPFLSEHSLATPSLGGDVMKSRNHSGRKKTMV
jgi:hypothetical protein